jgi:(p)ppGpp synthase/HD superfamily hydrolase
MEKFDAKKAERLLRNALCSESILKELNVTVAQIKEVVQAEAIRQIQKERLNYGPAKELKKRLFEIFPEYRFSARVKSLTSIFAKMARRRTLADVFGIKVVVPTVEECYSFGRFLEERYEIFDYEDKIVNPKENGYRDLKIVINYPVEGSNDILVEFIIQTFEMYVDAHTIQEHSLVFPWKYEDVIVNLPAEYGYIKF